MTEFNFKIDLCFTPFKQGRKEASQHDIAAQDGSHFNIWWSNGCRYLLLKPCRWVQLHLMLCWTKICKTILFALNWPLLNANSRGQSDEFTSPWAVKCFRRPLEIVKTWQYSENAILILSCPKWSLITDILQNNSGGTTWFILGETVLAADSLS